MRQIQISESQFKNIMGAYHITFDNPISLSMSDSKSLNEGTFKTYPPEKVQKYIINMFRLPSDWVNFEESEQGGVYFFWLRVRKSLTLIEQIIKAMNLCGYFCSIKQEDKEPEFIILQFEPRHQNNANEEVRAMDYIYHVSPSYNLNKILKSGFTPKTKNSLFDYPDRVYFFKQHTTEDELNNLTYHLCCYNKSLGNNNKYVIFIIDVKEIPQNVNFYLDGNYANGIYTTDNIPPSAIVDAAEFEIDSTAIEEDITKGNCKKFDFNIDGYSSKLKK
jgi:hypothetical protein